MKVRTFQIIIGLLFLLTGGCKMTPQQQIEAAREAVPILEQAVERLDAQIAILQQGMAATEQVLADPNLSFGDKEKARARLAEYVAELQKWRDLKEPTTAALARVRLVLEKGPQGVADLQDVLRMANEAIVAVAPLTPPPVQAWLSIVSIVLTALVTLFGTGGAVALKQLATMKTAFREVVAGGEQLKVAQPAAVPAFREAQAKAQKHESTRLLVDKVQKQLVP